MRQRLLQLMLLILLPFSRCLVAGEAERPLLHRLFSDQVVLQRDIPVPVWGWAEAGKEVTVSLDGAASKAVADAQGRWQAKVGPFPAGGPHTLTVSGPPAAGGPDQSVMVKEVLFGDVWICSGQSNMEMGIGNVLNAKEEIEQANYPQIRLFTVPHLIASEPQAQVVGQWLACTSASVASGGWNGFSAVGYFFGRDLHRELKVPIGLIHTSWGGTIAEAWTSAEALKTMDDFRAAVEGFQQNTAEAKKGTTDHEQQLVAWYAKNDPGTAAGWNAPAFDAGAWKTMQLPTNWEKAGLPDFDGIVWFRREFELPEAWANKDVMLHLGPIDDMDTTWVNGTKVGGREQWTDPRDYKIPSRLLKPGKNVIAVRVLDTGGDGGIYGKPSDMHLDCEGQPPIPLTGPWKYQDSTPLAKTSPLPQAATNNPNIVTVLYNGMIANLVPFAIKGAIWYQGESNGDRGMQYRRLLPTMIKDWRARFAVGDFPFYIVSLANYKDPEPEPTDPAWATLREAQLLTALTLPGCGLAVAIDVGDAKDIHPKNKQEVGRRLALNALAQTYGQHIEYQGPLFKEFSVDGAVMRLTFDHLGGGLIACDYGGKPADKLVGFAVCGENRHFVWAEARIDGDTVLVSSPQVGKPVAVRYAWAENPLCNLYNKAGLPAVPFRSDCPK
jgi:sialate O-acetylesterase